MTTIRYLWNPINQNIIREYDGAGNTVASYTTEPDLHGDVLSQHRDGEDSYYHTDGQGSTLAMTDANGDVTDTYAYSAFGEVTAQTGNTVNPYQYVGQKGYYRDGETGDYNVHGRTLDVNWERWLSVDPMISLVRDSNWPVNGPALSGVVLSYVYAQDNPLSDSVLAARVQIRSSYRNVLNNWGIDLYPGDPGAALRWYRYTCQLTTLGYAASCISAKENCKRCQVSPFACCATKVSSLVCSLLDPLRAKIGLIGSPIDPCVLGCMNLCMFSLWLNRRTLPNPISPLWTLAEVICASDDDCGEACCRASVAAEQRGATICSKWCGKQCDVDTTVWTDSYPFRVLFGWDLCCKRR